MKNSILSFYDRVHLTDTELTLIDGWSKSKTISLHLCLLSFIAVIAISHYISNPSILHVAVYITIAAAGALGLHKRILPTSITTYNTKNKQLKIKLSRSNIAIFDKGDFQIKTNSELAYTRPRYQYVSQIYIDTSEDSFLVYEELSKYEDNRGDEVKARIEILAKYLESFSLNEDFEETIIGHKNYQILEAIHNRNKPKTKIGRFFYTIFQIIGWTAGLITLALFLGVIVFTFTK